MLRSTDPDVIEARAFYDGVRGLFDRSGLKTYPVEGGYLDQPSELLEVLQLIGDSIEKRA